MTTKEFHIATLLLGPGYRNGGCLSADPNTFEPKFTESGRRKLKAEGKARLELPYFAFTAAKSLPQISCRYDPESADGERLHAEFIEFVRNFMKTICDGAQIVVSP